MSQIRKKRHRYCQRTGNSWCKYQNDKLIDLSTYNGNMNIDKAVSDVIAPVLSSDDLGSEYLLKNVYIDKRKVWMMRWIIWHVEHVEAKTTFE